MKKTPSHITARVEIERQISFFSFGFARVSEVRHMCYAREHNTHVNQLYIIKWMLKRLPSTARQNSQQM